MSVLQFFSAWLSDWTARMSGLASVVFALWVTIYTPDAALNKWVLVALAVLFFITGSYHIWVKEHYLLLAEKAKHERFKLTFEIDEQASSLSFKDAISLTIIMRFENRDAHDWTMKHIDFSLYKIEPGTKKEMVTLFSVLFRNFRSKEMIPNERFEPMLVHGGTITQYYEVGVFMDILDQAFRSFEEDHYLVRVGMEAMGQPIYEKDYQLIANKHDKTAALMSLTEESFHAMRRGLRRLN